jgi:formate dehydrogenase
MMILALVRNYLPTYQWVVKGGWNIADCVARSYDVEGMHVGTVAAGRIDTAILRRLKPFDVHLHYFDRQRLPEAFGTDPRDFDGQISKGEELWQAHQME